MWLKRVNNRAIGHGCPTELVYSGLGMAIGFDREEIPSRVHLRLSLGGRDGKHIKLLRVGVPHALAEHIIIRLSGAVNGQ